MAKTIKAKAVNSISIPLPPPPKPALASKETIEKVSISVNILESKIIKPTNPIKPNDLKASLTFTSPALKDCIVKCRATFNVDIKIILMEQYTPNLAFEFSNFVNNTDPKVLNDKGFLSNFFYDELELTFNQAIAQSNQILLKYSQIFLEQSIKKNSENLDFQILGYTNNLQVLVGKNSLKKDFTNEFLFQNLILNLSGKDVSESNSLGLAANEQFKVFFFNSEKVQEITPTFSQGNNVFSNLALPIVSSVVLGKNIDKV